MKIIHKRIFILSFNGVVWETEEKGGKRDTNNGSEKVHDSILIWTATRRCARSLRWCRQSTTKRPLYWRDNIFDHVWKWEQWKGKYFQSWWKSVPTVLWILYFFFFFFFTFTFHLRFFFFYVVGKIAYSNTSFTPLPLYFITVFVCIYQWFKLPLLALPLRNRGLEREAEEISSTHKSILKTKTWQMSLKKN